MNTTKNEYNHLTKQLALEFLKQKPQENSVFSAYSILSILAIAAQATSSDTRSEILNAISPGLTYGQLETSVREYTKTIKACHGVSVANAAIIKNTIKDSILPDYIEKLKAAYDGDAIISSNLMRDVNEWVNKKTNGMIRNILNKSIPDMLSGLINAIYFESKWKQRYESDDIYEESDFTNIDGSTSEVTMLSSEEHEYLENDFFTGFLRPYRNGFSFMGLLPKKEGPGALEEAIKSSDMEKLYEGRTSDTVQVSFPEFSVEFGDDLTDICKKLGIKRLFTNDADFSPMSTENLKMKAIMHKAKIDVDRNGTKAAAATLDMVCAGCAMPFDVKYVDLDRPFVYAIVNDELGIPVFTGIINTL